MEEIVISGIVIKKVVNYNDGILFEVMSDEYYKCYYDKKYSISNKDLVSCTGEFVDMIINGENIKVFNCFFVSARCKIDLFIFLSNYFTTMETDQLNDMVLKFDQFASLNGEDIIEVLGNLSENCIKSYESVKSDIILLAETVFFYMEDEDKRILLIKGFLQYYYSQYLHRPLELLGIPKEIIQTFKIPLNKAYEICKENPLRIPQIPFEIAKNIFLQHFREEATRIQLICGNINRMVLNKLDNARWTSVPVSFIKQKISSVEDHLDLLIKEYFLKFDHDSLYFDYILKCEDFVINKIYHLLRKPKNQRQELVFPSDIPTDEQIEAINNALENNISILNGVGGTGKTCTMEHIVRNTLRKEKKILCTSFTGKATGRVKEILFNSQLAEQCIIATLDLAIMSQLKFDLVIIDEISMVTTELFYRFMRTYQNDKFSIVLVGDINQLPPISWGSLFKQLLLTGVNITSLTKNFRSEKTMLIIFSELISKERIQNRNFVNWSIISDGDYHFHIGNTNRVKDILINFKNRFLKQSSSEEEYVIKRSSVTIVTPFKNVCSELNKLFQSLFMFGESVMIDYRKWFVGDRVILRMNNYSINTTNGTEGSVIEIFDDHIIVVFNNDPNTMCPFVSKMTWEKLRKIQRNIKTNGTNIYDEKDVDLYNKLIEKFKLFAGNLDLNTEFFILSEKTLIHSYCITTHLSQGSEYINCIFYLPDRNINFINVNLIYTGISRAKKTLNIVTESLDTLNECSLRYTSYTSENLALKINEKCCKLNDYQQLTIQNDDFEMEEDYGNDDFDLDDF